MSFKAEIYDLLKKNPMFTTSDLVEITGCAKRTARAYKNMFQTDGMQGDLMITSAPKILLFDLETSPLEVLTWGLYKQLVLPQNVMKSWAILSWAAKWLFDDEVMGQRVTVQEADARDDKSIIQGLWDLLNEADMIIAHNAVKFDVRRMNARFAVHGMDPPMPYVVIDTLRHAKKTFDFPSFKLDDINEQFSLGSKHTTGLQLWKRCCYGEAEDADKALNEMLDYNKQDVVILEELYLRIRPWIKSHPNVNLYVNASEIVGKCPNCGYHEITWGGLYVTPAGRYKAFRCDDCGAIGRSRYSDISKDEKKDLFLSVAR
jgi:predicted RNA-binding Zn-ribbon protein involved in translation (DUF1610 family)